MSEPRAGGAAFAQDGFLLKAPLVGGDDLNDLVFLASAARVQQCDDFGSFPFDLAARAPPLTVVCATVSPSGKRGVMVSSRKRRHSASLTVPPPGRLRPKYSVSRTIALSALSQASDERGAEAVAHPATPRNMAASIP